MGYAVANNLWSVYVLQSTLVAYAATCVPSDGAEIMLIYSLGANMLYKACGLLHFNRSQYDNRFPAPCPSHVYITCFISVQKKKLSVFQSGQSLDC